MVRKKCENFAITLHKEQVMDNNLLYHTTGLKIAGGQYHKVKGPKAKEFCNNTPAYIYPLFKTHKLKQERFESTSPELIPIRFLQFAGKIFISRFTAFLEYILQPISAKFCQAKIDEYFQDSKSYLKMVTESKTNQMKKPKQKESLYLVAADVTALYPTRSRNLVRQALQVVSLYSQKATKTIVEMVMLYLENVVTQFEEKFCKERLA